MRALRHRLIAIFALVIAAMATPAHAGSECAATLYTGGTIITMRGESPETVEAVAVCGGRIIATGTRNETAAAAGEDATVIDLAGRTMLPGFIDAHGHVSGQGQVAVMAGLAAPPLGTVDSIAALQAALGAYIADNGLPPGAPVIGFGYDDSQLAENRHPTRHDLDAVAANRPILITHTSGHLAVMNTAMLALAGIKADTPDPDGGIIRREADGRTPDGVLEESAFFRAAALLQPSDMDRAVDAVVRGERIYAGYGVTTAQDGRVTPEAWPALAEAARRGVLMLDTVVLIAGERQWDAATEAMVGQPYRDRLRIAGMKLSLDGSPQGRTAWLADPVPVPPPGKDSDYHGYPAYTPELLDMLMAKAAANGWQVFAHVNGDAAAQALIDGVRSHGLAGRRTIAIHNQVVTPEQLAEQAELDIQPSFFVSHTYFWGDWHREVALGPKRADFISPLASGLAAGLTPSIHNDSPVTPPDMMRLIWSAVNRRTQSGDILGPAERVSPYAALKMITANAAWQIHEEGDKGTIETGKRADLVVLDTNPLTDDPVHLHEIGIVATIKDGVIIHGSLE
ncbi:MAG: amidohydrolase [Blastomonas sp.]